MAWAKRRGPCSSASPPTPSPRTRRVFNAGGHRGVFNGCLMGFSMGFQWVFNEFSRDFQRFSRVFKGFSVVFKGRPVEYGKHS